MRKKKEQTCLKCFIIIFFLILFSVLVFHRFEKSFFPVVMEISEYQSKQQATKIMDTAIQMAIKEMKVTSSDFFITNVSTDTIAANTLLVNSFCSYISNEMTKSLEKMKKEEIKVPVGIISGVEFLATRGPAISFWLVPKGNVNVDYETNFTAVGINQMHFKIWLDISMELEIVNPLIDEKLVLKRKMMLVDTVIRGVVPENYIDLQGKENEFDS